MFLQRMLGRTVQRDGAAAALEVPATGLDLAALAASPDGSSFGAATGRDRSAGDGEDALVGAVAAKLLNGWLQNRQQTLYPLSLNLRTLAPPAEAILATILAIAAGAGNRATDAAADAGRCRAWLVSVGARAEAVAVFDRALIEPPALSTTLQAAVAADLAVYAYVVALVGCDPRSPPSMRFLDYLEAWLDLPTAVVRSATRKYRR